MNVEIRDGDQIWKVESERPICIGTAEICDIVLPRADFLELGRQELALEEANGALRILSLHPEHETLVDGKPVAQEGMQLAPGTYSIAVDGRTFMLVFGL